VVVSAIYNAPIVYVRGKEIPHSLEEYLLHHNIPRIIVVGVQDSTIDKIEASYRRGYK
jgi:hypothetical protein